VPPFDASRRVASRNAEGTLTEMALLIEAALTDTLSHMRRVASPPPERVDIVSPLG
jgi:hypothetical protein